LQRTATSLLPASVRQRNPGGVLSSGGWADHGPLSRWGVYPAST